MTQEEVDRSIKNIAGLFSGQVTQDQAKWLRQELKPFAYQPAMKAISAHRGTHEFLNFPQLIEGCRAEERGDLLSAKTNAPPQSFASMCRGYRPDLRNAGDYEVIIRVHRYFWRSSRQADGHRSKFTAECRHALWAAGMEPKDAEEWTGYLFVEDHECPRWLELVRQLRTQPSEKENGGVSGMTGTEDILSPQLRAVIERCAAEHGRDKPNLWKNFDRVNAWLFFNTDSAEAQAAAIKL